MKNRLFLVLTVLLIASCGESQESKKVRLQQELMEKEAREFREANEKILKEVQEIQIKEKPNNYWKNRKG